MIQDILTYTTVIFAFAIAAKAIWKTFFSENKITACSGGCSGGCNTRAEFLKMLESK
ncbi:FeoB-associated Cys-rich membrane protein [Alkalitalea saponilacus]|nr:FeoB-associated Cys-rich membrane protein [Alkalitalea saponilacus]